MKPYVNIPVELARQIAQDFDKQIVVVCAWNHAHAKLHTTTYGVEPKDKRDAAKAGEICAKALGMDIGKSETFEDFRTVDASNNAQLRDLAKGVIHALRSYENGNSSPDLAKDFADRLENVLKVNNLTPP